MGLFYHERTVAALPRERGHIIQAWDVCFSLFDLSRAIMQLKRPSAGKPCRFAWVPVYRRSRPFWIVQRIEYDHTRKLQGVLLRQESFSASLGADNTDAGNKFFHSTGSGTFSAGLCSVLGIKREARSKSATMAASVETMGTNKSHQTERSFTLIPSPTYSTPHALKKVFQPSCIVFMLSLD